MTDRTNADRRLFRRTLARVLAMQVVALAVLWLLQTSFTP
jgi:hypothetical protein